MYDPPGVTSVPTLISIVPTGLTTSPWGWLRAPVDISARPTGAIWMPWGWALAPVFLFCFYWG